MSYNFEPDFKTLQLFYDEFYINLLKLVENLEQPDALKKPTPTQLRFIAEIPKILQPKDPSFSIEKLSLVLDKLEYITNVTQTVTDKLEPFLNPNTWFVSVKLYLRLWITCLKNALDIINGIQGEKLRSLKSTSGGIGGINNLKSREDEITFEMNKKNITLLVDFLNNN